MKKFITITLIIGLLLTLNACEDLLTFKFDTNFRVNMNIDVDDDGKSDTFPFTNTELLNIEDDEEVAEQIEMIKGLEITEIECTITGIPSGESIPELNVVVEEIDLTVTLTNVTEDYTLVLPISDELLNVLSTYLFENHQTTITVSGESTYAPMVLGVNLLFNSTVEAAL
jgi:hypothetical protein